MTIRHGVILMQVKKQLIQHLWPSYLSIAWWSYAYDIWPIIAISDMETFGVIWRNHRVYVGFIDNNLPSGFMPVVSISDLSIEGLFDEVNGAASSITASLSLHMTKLMQYIPESELV